MRTWNLINTIKDEITVTLAEIVSFLETKDARTKFNVRSGLFWVVAQFILGSEGISVVELRKAMRNCAPRHTSCTWQEAWLLDGDSVRRRYSYDGHLLKFQKLLANSSADEFTAEELLEIAKKLTNEQNTWNTDAPARH